MRTTHDRHFLATIAASATAVACLLVVLVAGVAWAGEAKGHEKPAAEKQGETLKKAETKKVCMVNDTLFEKDQIPVAVEGKTYYGCCAMCKERLAKDAEIRSAVDPLTGKKVDKATAVIAARADGSVLYFESEETLAKYKQKEQKQKDTQ